MVGSLGSSAGISLQLSWGTAGLHSCLRASTALGVPTATQNAIEMSQSHFQAKICPSKGALETWSGVAGPKLSASTVQLEGDVG